MNEPVTLAALGIVATSVASLVWLVKYLLTTFRKSLDKNTESNRVVARSNEKITEMLGENTKSNKEVAQMARENTQYLKNLNGRLVDITAEKMQQQIRSHE